MNGLARIRPGRWTGYDVVRVVLGLTLLIAAALKAHELATQPILGRGILNSRWLLIGVVEFEFCLGFFLIAGLYPQWTRFVAIGCFALFAGVSLYKALSGEATCGCLGELHLNPWYSFTFDVGVSVALMPWWPAAKSPKAHRTRLPFGTCVFTIVGLGGISAVGLWGAQTRLAWYASGAGLEVAPGDLDFGEQWAQRSFPWTLHLANVTSDDIEVREFRASCACVSVEPRSFVVPAGGHASVRLALDLTRYAPPAEGPDLQRCAVDLLPITDRRQPTPIRWLLHGGVRKSPVAVSVSLVHFSNIILNDPTPRSQTIEIECRDPAVTVAAHCGERAAVVRVRQRPNSDTKRDLEIVLRPASLGLGEHRFAVTLRPGVPLESPLARLAPLPDGVVEVAVSVQHAVYPTRAFLPLGAARVGARAEGTVTLNSLDGRRFEVIEVKGVPEGSITAQSVGAAQRTHIFRLSQRLLAEGPQRGEARFRIVEEGSRSPYEVAVPLVGHGLKAD